MEKFFLYSPNIDEKFHLPQVYPLCGGNNVSPELKWENAPATTKSFAVTMFDPDAPTEHGWWHWLVVNIPKEITKLPENAGSPTSEFFDLGIQTVNDYGEIGYGGPCPPPGPPHRYILTVYALSIGGFKISKEINPGILNEYIQKYAIDKASVIGFYQRGWK